MATLEVELKVPINSKYELDRLKTVIKQDENTELLDWRKETISNQVYYFIKLRVIVNDD